MRIDTSDIPEITAEEWNHAVRGKFYRPVKRQITARVDAEVVEWLKAGGEGVSVAAECDFAAGDAGEFAAGVNAAVRVAVALRPRGAEITG